MNDEELRESPGTDETSRALGASKPGRRISALARVSRGLRASELVNNKAALKLILDANDRLEYEVEDLKSFKDRYYDERQNAAVLREKINAFNGRTVFQVLGSIGLGLLPTIHENFSGGVFAGSLVIFGFCLLLGLFGQALEERLRKK